MSGETDLQQLLRHLSPQLTDAEYVYCSFAGARYGDHADLEPIAAIEEREGLTLVVPRAAADARQFEYGNWFRLISLRVHSSLEAVGLTAAIAGKLAARGFSANVLAGFYHDHILVPAEDADSALAALAELAAESN